MENDVAKLIYKQVSAVRNHILWIHILIMILTSVLIFSCGVYYYDRNTVNHDAALCGDMNGQMVKSMEAFMTKSENNCKLFLANSEYTAYSASSAKKDEYKSLKLEEEMGSYLENLSLADNYSDFGVIYSNNHAAGKISDGTLDLYGADIYSKLENSMSGKTSAWVTGFGGSYRRAYYIRRVNKDALFVSSFFCTEFDRYFSSTKNGTVTALCDCNGTVIYSMGSEKISDMGSLVFKLFDNKHNFTTVGTDYAGATDDCSNGWQIITLLDISDRNILYKKIGVVSGFILLLMIIFHTAISYAISSKRNPRNKYLTDTVEKMASLDGVTGLHNGEYTENRILDKIETCITGSTIVLLVVKVTNLELINSNYGRDEGDRAMAIVADLLKGFFDENDVVGKLGGNEFVAFADYTDYDLLKAHENLKVGLQNLSEKLNSCILENDRGSIVTAIGAAVYPDNSNDYDELYEMAEQALAQACEKHSRTPVVYDAKGQGAT